MINYNEFEVLVHIEKNSGKKLTNSEITNATKINYQDVFDSLSTLIEKNLIKKDLKGNIFITKDGYEELEPYKVKRAIILAAGMGNRMKEQTTNTPKPLVKVNGKRMIETLLDALKASHIDDITIVRGYLAEKFDDLLIKYPNIKFIESKLYDTSNNISSALLVKDKLDNAYILEADLYLYNPDLIRKYEYTSNYLGKYVKQSDDLVFETEGKTIKELKLGGSNCYQMYGISYFNKEDSKKFSKDVEYVFNMVENGKSKYWDNVHLNVFKDNYSFRVRECYEGDIIEIDTYEELKQVDKSYI